MGLLLARVLSAEDWDLLYRLAASIPGGGFLTRYWRRDVELTLVTDPMRILHLTPYYKPAYAFGGVVRSVEGMATSLVSDAGLMSPCLTTDALDQQQPLRRSS